MATRGNSFDRTPSFLAYFRSFLGTGWEVDQLLSLLEFPFYTLVSGLLISIRNLGSKMKADPHPFTSTNVPY